MSKKFIVLILFAGVFVSSFKSFAGPPPCSPIKNSCLRLFNKAEFQQLDNTERRIKSGSLGKLFCLFLKPNSWPGDKSAEKIVEENAAIVGKCEQLWSDASVDLPSLCEQSVAEIKKQSGCTD